MTSDYIMVIGFLCVAIVYLTVSFAGPVLKDRYNGYKRKWYEKKYKAEVIGEVVGSTQELRYDTFLFLATGGSENGIGRETREEWEMVTYSPIVKYTVNGYTYEINAKEYTTIKPEPGQRAVVVYNPKNPADACARIERSIFEPLEESEAWKQLDSEKSSMRK